MTVCTVDKNLFKANLLKIAIARVRGYKIFFVLNSAVHEILNAHKFKSVKKFIILQTQISLECYLFFLLINVKMPTTVGILTFMSRKNFMLN